MQLTLIFGIAFAIGAVVFALQNNSPVAVTLAMWRFEGSLAIALLLAPGLGVKWHPEFHAPQDTRLLPREPLIEAFLRAAAVRKEDAHTA